MRARSALLTLAGLLAAGLGWLAGGWLARLAGYDELSLLLSAAFVFAALRLTETVLTRIPSLTKESHP